MQQPDLGLPAVVLREVPVASLTPLRDLPSKSVDVVGVVVSGVYAATSNEVSELPIVSFVPPLGPRWHQFNFCAMA